MPDDNEYQERDDTEYDRLAQQIYTYQFTSQPTIPRTLVVPHAGDPYKNQPVKHTAD